MPLSELGDEGRGESADGLDGLTLDSLRGVRHNQCGQQPMCMWSTGSAPRNFWLEQWDGWVKTPGRGRSSQEQLVLGEWRPRERVELPAGETVRGQWSRHAAPPKRRQKRPGAREEQKLLRSQMSQK